MGLRNPRRSWFLSIGLGKVGCVIRSGNVIYGNVNANMIFEGVKTLLAVLVLFRCACFGRSLNVGIYHSKTNKAADFMESFSPALVDRLLPTPHRNR